MPLLRSAAIGATLAVALAVALPAAAPPAAAQGPETDFLKRSDNFLKNCDPRPDETGKRPEPNYICLGFMAGLIEGYKTAAVANGNRQPYCLPRPVALVEIMDMIVTAIERGAPPDLPTATAYHFVLEANFPCSAQSEAAPASEPVAPAAAE